MVEKENIPSYSLSYEAGLEDTISVFKLTNV
jgi:hypothetical protein